MDALWFARGGYGSGRLAQTVLPRLTAAARAKTYLGYSDAAALLGALPLVLESGTGSELRFPLGVTIVGGLLLSQFLTLYTTPAIYLAFERVRLAWGGERKEGVLF